MVVSILPGINASVVLGTLESAANELSNIVSGDKYELFNRYCRWANLTAPALARLLSLGDVEGLVLTHRHWVIQAIDPSANDSILSLLNAEINERVEDLRRAHNDLMLAVRRWEGPADVLVADTNVFLHHRLPFGAIPWHELVVSPEEPSLAWICLAIPIIVVDELDKAKRGNYRRRARECLKTMEEMFRGGTSSITFNGAPTSSLTQVQLIIDDPHHVRLADPDMELIDRAESLASLANGRVTLVTFDTGMALRGRSVGRDLEVLLLSDEERADFKG